MNALQENEIVALGASLRPISPGLLKPGRMEGSVRVWYQGGEPYFDVFFEVCEEQVLWFQFTLRGRSLSWSRRCELQTGSTNELLVSDGAHYPASKTIQADSQNDQAFVNLVCSILESRAEEPLFQQTLAELRRSSCPVD
ncbi:hypothetical protein [Geitlerinema sp. PCC 7407]|uniref:hypothetical protein n=1 Tax=Geitlerinema sp. PCC 7407 TaxID=1173025 RepID=UPI00029FF732|nr:hypothetical protein [Geitlerinema sp. PCC 7407]AFY66130.1 hypothetical protein GEI7407_1639 [Geitlerinema sp. PCC 7407]